MAEMPDVATLTTITIDWGNQIRDRTIQRYSSVANRTTEHGSPAEGDLSYLEDSNTVWVYDGSAWKNIAGPVQTADIADSAVTSAKIADGTVVAADLAGSVAQGLIQIDGNMNVTTNALVATFVDRAVIAFTKPASWTTFRIMAWGYAYLASMTTPGEARMNIGGGTGPIATVPAPAGGNVTAPLAVFHTLDSGASSFNVAVQCRQPSDTGNHVHSYVAYLAHRLT